MIHSTLEGSARYEGLHPLFKEAFDYIKTHDLLALESQRIELRGEDLFINRMDAPSQIYQPLEAHEEHIDIQVLLKGRERIGWLPRAQCQEPQAPYDKEKDVIFFEDTPSELRGSSPRGLRDPLSRRCSCPSHWRRWRCEQACSQDPTALA